MVQNRVSNYFSQQNLKLVGLTMIWLGYFLPWVPHHAAALSMGAYDLAAWVMLLPQVQDGSIAISRLHFLGLISFAIVLTFEVSLQGGVWRWLFLVVGLGIIMMIPSYPDILYFRTDLMVQSQIALVGATLLMIVALWYWRNWRWMKIVQGIVAALVGYGALRALLLIRPAVGILYGTIPEIGLGWYITLLGCLFVFVSIISDNSVRSFEIE